MTFKGLFLTLNQSLTTTVDSRYYELWYNDMLLITMPFQYDSHHQPNLIYTGYIDSLDILILLPDPNSIFITRVYCSVCGSQTKLQSMLGDGWTGAGAVSLGYSISPPVPLPQVTRTVGVGQNVSGGVGEARRCHTLVRAVYVTYCYSHNIQ